MTKKRRTKHSAKFAPKAVSSAIRPKGNPEDKRKYPTELLGAGLDPAYQYRVRLLSDRAVIQRSRKPVDSSKLGVEDWEYFAEVRHSTKADTRESDRVQAYRIIQTIEALGQHRTWLKDNTDELDKVRRVIREQAAEIGRLQGELLNLTGGLGEAHKPVPDLPPTSGNVGMGFGGRLLTTSEQEQVLGFSVEPVRMPDPPSCPHPGYSTVWKHGEDGANSPTLRISCDKCGFVFWDRNKPADPEELRRVVSLADKLGWDGVNNSKMLSVFLKEHIADLMHKAADEAIAAVQARETVRDLESRLAAAEKAAREDQVTMKVLKGVSLADCYLEGCHMVGCHVANGRMVMCSFKDTTGVEANGKVTAGERAPSPIPNLPWPETQINPLIRRLTEILDRQSLYEDHEVFDINLKHGEAVTLRDVARWALDYFGSLAKSEATAVPSSTTVWAKQVGSLRAKIASQDEQYAQLSARKTVIEEDLAKAADKLARAEGVIRNIGRILNGPDGSPDAQFSPGNVVEMAKDLMHTSNRDSARLKAAYLALRPLVPEASFEEVDVTADIVDWAKSLREDLDRAKSESARLTNTIDLVGSALLATGKVGSHSDMPGHVRVLIRERNDYQSKCGATENARTIDLSYLEHYKRQVQTIADILAPNDKRPLNEKPLAKWVGDLVDARKTPSPLHYYVFDVERGIARALQDIVEISTREGNDEMSHEAVLEAAPYILRRIEVEKMKRTRAADATKTDKKDT